MQAAGVMNVCGAGSSIDGYAARRIREGFTHVLGQEAEKTLGMSQPAFRQTRGTCVDQGGVRALQDALYFAIAQGTLVTTPIRVARGPVYAMVRRKWGYKVARSQDDDGINGAQWAEIAATVGVYALRDIGKLLLSKNEEQHAIEWGNNGVPPGLEKLGVRVRAHRPRSNQELADCLWAGYFAAQCSGSYFEGRGGNGMAVRRSLNGQGHCEEVAGAFVSPSGKTHFVRQQSWGDQAPQPQPFQITPADSPEITLRGGSYPVHSEDMAALLAQGEVWAFQWVKGFDKL